MLSVSCISAAWRDGGADKGWWLLSRKALWDAESRCEAGSQLVTYEAPKTAQARLVPGCGVY